MVNRFARYAGLLYPAVALWFLGALLFDARPIGYRHDWNIPFEHLAMQRMWSGTDGFTYWNQDQLGGPPFYPTIAPFYALLSFLATLSFAPWLVVRLVIFVTLIVAGFGADRLARSFGTNAAGARLAGLAFMSSAFVFTEMSKGVLQDPLSYALMPWTLVAFRRSRRDGDVIANGFALDRAALAAGVLWAIGSLQVQYLALNAIDLVVFAIFERRAIALGFAAVTLVLVDAYYLVPYVANLSTISATLSAMSPVREIYALSPSFGAAVRNTGCDCRFPEQALEARGLIAIWATGGFLFAVAALAAGVLRRERVGYVLAGTFVVATVLTAGTSLLGPVYPWLVQHVPSAYAFRESFKFGALPALFGALLVARLPELLERYAPVRRAAWGIACALVVWNGLPFFASGLATQLNRVSIPPSASEAFAFEDRAAPEIRVGFVPNLVPVQPEGSTFTGIDPFISWAPRPSFGNYVPAPFTKLLSSALYHHRVDEFRTLARMTSVRYFDVREWLAPFFAQASAAKDTDLDRDVYTTANAVRTLRDAGATVVARWPKEAIYDLGEVQTSAVVGGNGLTFVAGNFEALPLLESGNRVLAFAAQTSSPEQARALLADARELVIVDGDDFDLVSALLPRRYQLEPGNFATGINANGEWGNAADWNSWWWFNHDMIEAPERIAIAGSQNHQTMTMSFAELGGEDAHVFVKAFTNARAGRLAIDVGGRRAVVITNEARGAVYRWFDLGTATPRDGRVDIALQSLEGENAIARVVVAPESVFSHARREADRLEGSSRTATLVTRNAERLSLAIPSGSYRVTLAAPSGFARAAQTSLDIGSLHATFSPAKGARGVTRVLSLGRGLPGTLAFAPSLDPAIGGVLLEPAASDATPLPAYATGTIREKFDILGDVNWLYRLTTSFNPQWRASDPSALHFVANGYANGWTLPHGGKHQIALASVDLGRLCRAISLLTLAALGATFAGPFVRERLRARARRDRTAVGA